MRRSVFLRCLLFYLLFLLVLMGMYVPLYRLNLNMITEKSVQVSETMLYSRLKQFEYELSQTRTLSTRLSGTAALTQLSHISVPPTGKDVYKAYNALGTYGTLTSLLPAGMTAGMYLSNGVAMVGEYLFYTMEEMYQFASDSRFETHAQWRAFVNDFTGPSCLFAERQITMMDRTFPALEYAVRMPLTSNSSSKLLFVFITGESVHELLSLTDLYPDTVLRLYDGNGALLLGRGDEGGQAYTWISAAIHAGYSLSVELGVPTRVFSAQLKRFTYVYGAFILCYLVIGACLAVFLSYRSSRPIMRILGTVMGYMPQERLPRQLLRHQNAYQYLDSFVHGAQNRFKDYEDLLTSQENELRRHTFQALLRNTQIDGVELSRAERYLANFPSDYRLIHIALTFEGEMDLERYSSLQVVLLSIVNKELPCAIAQFMGSSLFAVIDANLSRETLESALLRVRAAIDRTDSVRSRIVAGSAMSGVETLGQARKRTQILLRSTMNPMIYADDWAWDASALNAAGVLQSTQRFYHCLVNADADGAAAILRDTARSAGQAGVLTESCAAYLFYSFLGPVIRLRDEMGKMGVAEGALPEFDPTANVETLFAPIETYVRWAAGLIQASRERETNELSSRVVSFVDENLSDSELCAASAAAQLGMTENEVKKAMLRATGKTFFDYIDTERMRRVKEALLTTELSVSEIMAQCGYHSLNTLYKAFKRTYGVSPKQMREQMKKETME